MRARTTWLALISALVLATSAAGCAGPERTASTAAAVPIVSSGHVSLDRPRTLDPLLDTLQERTFRWFWDTAQPETGLVPDRWPSRSFSSVAAVGFGLTAYPVGVARGWVGRAEAAARTRRTLAFLYDAPQNDGPHATGTHGFFYHFLDMETGARFETVELSTVDTALLVAGALAAGQFFDGDAPDEVEVRRLAEALYARVEWTWAQPRPPLVALGWKPPGEPGGGFLPYDYGGYNETMLLYVLALGSPTHPIDAAAWPAYTATYTWGERYGQEHLGFAPLFGHQYSHTWIDFRGIRDAPMRAHGLDYAENSRRATLAQRAYATDNPDGWRGYGPDVWGLTASDGPLDTTITVAGAPREVHTYWARGVAPGETRDDGTLAPTAAASSVAFTPDESTAAVRAMRTRYGAGLWGTYGFFDAFNPTYDLPESRLQHGRMIAGLGWFDTDYLGIDQGPIVLMIENRRSELVWSLMRSHPAIRRGLTRAGFTGGWLDAP